MHPKRTLLGHRDIALYTGTVPVKPGHLVSLFKSASHLTHCTGASQTCNANSVLCLSIQLFDDVYHIYIGAIHRITRLSKIRFGNLIVGVQVSQRFGDLRKLIIKN